MTNELITFAVIAGKLIDKTEKGILIWERVGAEDAYINNLTGVVVESDGRVFDKYNIYIGRSYKLFLTILIITMQEKEMEAKDDE